jgi:hypothetical protein
MRLLGKLELETKHIGSDAYGKPIMQYDYDTFSIILGMHPMFDSLYMPSTPFNLIFAFIGNQYQHLKAFKSQIAILIEDCSCCFVACRILYDIWYHLYYV